MNKTMKIIAGLASVLALTACNGNETKYNNFFGALTLGKTIEENTELVIFKGDFSSKLTYETSKTIDTVSKEETKSESSIVTDSSNGLSIYTTFKKTGKYVYLNNPENDSTINVDEEHYYVFDRKAGVVNYTFNHVADTKTAYLAVSMEQILSIYEMLHNESFPMTHYFDREPTIYDAAKIATLSNIFSDSEFTHEGVIIGAAVQFILDADFEEELGDEIVSTNYVVDFNNLNLKYDITINDNCKIDGYDGITNSVQKGKYEDGHLVSSSSVDRTTGTYEISESNKVNFLETTTVTANFNLGGKVELPNFEDYTHIIL